MMETLSCQEDFIPFPFRSYQEELLSGMVTVRVMVTVQVRLLLLRAKTSLVALEDCNLQLEWFTVRHNREILKLFFC